MSSMMHRLSRYLLEYGVISKPSFLLLLLILFCHSMASAQNADNVLNGLPSQEEVEALLQLSGALDGLSDDEKEHTINYTYKLIVLSYVQSTYQTSQACQSDVQTFCSTETANDINSCLIRNQDKLSVCCASNRRQQDGIRSGIPEPITYAGINLPKGSEKITASKPMRYKNMELSAGRYEVSIGGTTLWLNTLSMPYSKDGLYLPAKTRVEVHIDGTLSSANVIDGVKYKKLKLKPGSLIKFQKTGSVLSLTLDKGAELLGHGFSTFADIVFEKSGEFRSLVADEPIIINNMEFDGNWIYFHPSGKVRSGVLNVDTRANGILYAAGTEVIQNESGQVIHSWRRKPRRPNGKPPPPPPTTRTDSFGNVIKVFIAGPERGLQSQLGGPLTVDR